LSPKRRITIQQQATLLRQQSFWPHKQICKQIWLCSEEL